VLKLPARLVARFFVAVAAGSLGQGVDGDGQGAGAQVTQAAGAGQAAVANSATFDISKGETAAGGRMGGRQPGQVTDERGVHRAEARDRAGHLGLAEGRGQREGQVDAGGQAPLAWRWRG